MNSPTTSKRASSNSKDSPKAKASSKAKTASKAKASPVNLHKPEPTGSPSGLQKLFEDDLKDIYWTEKELTKAIPKMIKNASSEDLCVALKKHLKETESHVSRLENVFKLIDSKAQAKKCEAVAGLIEEADEMMSASPKGYVRDAAIISSAQKVEHYEMASYGIVCAFAKTLGYQKVDEILNEILEEEKGAYAKLTRISKLSINVHAGAEDGAKRKRA